MMNTALRKTLIVILVAAGIAPACADSYQPCSSSIEQAKRRKLFIQSVYATPQRFVWEGHDVEVFQSWLEQGAHGGADKLCIRFKVDGQLISEHRIAHEQQKDIDLAYRPGGAQVDGVYMTMPLSQLAHLAIGKAYGHITHFIAMPSPLRSSQQIVICTHTYGPKPAPTDVVLEISLSTPKPIPG